MPLPRMLVTDFAPRRGHGVELAGPGGSEKSSRSLPVRSTSWHLPSRSVLWAATTFERWRQPFAGPRFLQELGHVDTEHCRQAVEQVDARVEVFVSMPLIEVRSTWASKASVSCDICRAARSRLRFHATRFRASRGHWCRPASSLPGGEYRVLKLPWQLTLRPRHPSPAYRCPAASPAPPAPRVLPCPASEALISFRTFTSKPSFLALRKTSFLLSFSSASSISICSMRSTNERMRSPARPTVLT